MIQKMFINSSLEPRSLIQGGLKPDLLLINTEYEFAREGGLDMKTLYF